MAWDLIANLKGVAGTAVSLAELANRPKSRVPSLAAGTNLNLMHKQEHVGWWSFFAADVTNEPAGVGTAAAMLEVLAPSQYVAVQRVHDRSTRTTYERSTVGTADNTWSPWRSFAMSGDTMMKRGVIGDAAAFGNLNTYSTADHVGFWSLWAPFNSNVPKDARGRCMLQVLVDAVGFVSQLLTERESGRTWSRGMTGSVWDPWVDVTADRGMTSFRRALARSKNQTVNVVVVGDSNSEGFNIAEGLTERWINKLQPALNRVAGNFQGAQFPFIPAQYNMSEEQTPGIPVVLSGNTMSGSYKWGFGWRAATLRDGTSKAVFTFTGTKASLMYVQGPSGGVMDVSIDGAPPVAVSTNASSTLASRRWDTDTLVHGVHTVTVTMNSTTAEGQLIYLEGLLTWSNDESRGVRVIDGSFTGRRMVQVTPERASALALAMTQIGNVELVIVNLATNDARHGSDITEYRAAAESIVSAMRTRSVYAPVLFVMPFVGADHTRAQLEKYGVILGNTASWIGGAQFLDLSLAMPKIPADLTSAASQGLYVDTLHMSAQGHTIFAGHVLRAVTG